MQSQKHLFQLPDDIHYLNGAYMSPLLQSVEEAGAWGMARKRNPASIKAIDFFNGPEEVKIKFGRLINCKPAQVAIIPSASYGLKSATTNIPASAGTHAITISDEFPSGYYSIEEWCKEHNKELKIIKASAAGEGRGKQWTENILEAITNDTAAVVMSSIHWTDGTKFDLKRIGERCREANALFIVDGTQSVGAMPIDVVENKIDALVCASYKWLLGPYSIGLAYYSEVYNAGRPIEDSWLNRANVEDFTKLVSYEENYRPGAARFSMGESSNFMLMPMLNKSLEQLLEWQVPAIQAYSTVLIEPLVKFFNENNFWIEDATYRADHLFGFLPPSQLNKDSLLQQLQEEKIYVSFRGNAIRLSTHVYNTQNDIEKLLGILRNLRVA